MKRVTAIGMMILTVFMCLCLSGCSTKFQPITADQFSKAMENNKADLHESKDVPSTFSVSLSDDDTATITASFENGVIINHTTCNNKEDASTLYEAYKAYLDKTAVKSSGSSVSTKSVSLLNGKSYKVIKSYNAATVPGVYGYVQQVEECVVFFTISSDKYNDDVKTALEELDIKL